MSAELVPAKAIDPLALIDRAIEKGMDAAQLRELLALQREWKKDQAAEVFAVAISKFQEIAPRVMKRHTATIRSKDETKRSYEYQYASFDDVMRAIAPALSECGISVSFTTSTPLDKLGFLTVTVFLRVGIHVETREFTLPIPAMTVNDTQRFGAAVSYGKRYAIVAALNLVTTDIDDDARGLADVITEDQQKEIVRLCWIKGRTVEKLLNFIQCDTLAEMNARAFGIAKDYLSKLQTQRPDDPKEGGYE